MMPVCDNFICESLDLDLQECADCAGVYCQECLLDIDGVSFCDDCGKCGSCGLKAVGQCDHCGELACGKHITLQGTNTNNPDIEIGFSCIDCLYSDDFLDNYNPGNYEQVDIYGDQHYGF